MSSTSVAPRAGTHPTVARWVLAVAVVLGVLGMHALMGTPAGVPTDGAMSTSMAAHTNAGTSGSAPQGHAPGCGHSMLSPCLAVLGSLTTLVLLSLLAACWSGPAAAPPTQRPTALVRAGRPPPWTAPSLHQLSLLQV